MLIDVYCRKTEMLREVRVRATGAIVAARHGTP